MNAAEERRRLPAGIALFLVLVLIGILTSLALRSADDPVLLMKEGVAWLEKYQYGKAYDVFDRLAERHPRWVAARVNKGIAALNLLDRYLPIAEAEFKEALELDPRNTRALHCLGILYRHTNRFDEALDAFTRLVKIDPRAPFAQFFLGSTLMDLDRYEEARAALEEALRLQPSLSSAYWRLRTVYLKLGQVDRVGPTVEEFKRLEDGKAGLKADLKYGSSGRDSLAIRDSVPPDWDGPASRWTPPGGPVFGAAKSISSAPAVRRVRPDGRALTPAFCLGNLTGDDQLEVVLAGVSDAGGAAPDGPPKGHVSVHGRRAGGEYERLQRIDVDAVVAALGDLDGDGDSDLVLAGEGWLRLYANSGTGELQVAPLTVEGATHRGFPLRLLVADADSDWDLDIICMRQSREGDDVTTRVELLNNNRDGTFVDISEHVGIGPFDFPAAEMILADLDGDIDADIVIVDGESGRMHLFANERIWRYRRVEDGQADLPRLPGVTSTTVGDFDSDGDEDLLFFTPAGVELALNRGGLSFAASVPFRERFSALGDCNGVLGDFQAALRLGLLLLRPRGAESGAVFLAGAASERAVPVDSLEIDVPRSADLSAAFTAMVPCGPPELIVFDAEAGARAWPLEPADGRWIELQLEGPGSPIPDKERANVGAVGAVVEVHAGARFQTVQLHTGAAGTVRLSTRVCLGLGGAARADFVRILWPDGILQAEQDLTACKLHPISEVERKPSSCPILFVWNGESYEFVGDFLGVGGLGYFEGPGAYSTPDPTEFLLLPEPAAIANAAGVEEFHLDVLEPLEECTYLDELKLTVVDHPADVTVLPDEMFAIAGPAPGFRLLAFRERAYPIAARNFSGEDVTARLLEIDRRYGNRVELDRRFSGLARREHGVVMDFGEAIGDLIRREASGAPVYLFLYGFIEYGYSTSNFAAWQAGARFEAPTFEVERQGRWVPLREEWGFPAGYPRHMAVDLGGLLRPGDRRIRVRTNMEVFWDQAFLARIEPGETLRSVDLPADAAELDFAGFLPERSPDGRLPKIYAYGEFTPTATFKLFPGSYTRFGDVRELIDRTDDRFAILGPGDRLSVRVRADRLPPLATGMKRTFLLKTVGYCKDMDLYTAHPERVEPLPFQAMKTYPYSAGERYPESESLRRYREEWNTRRVEGTLMDGFLGVEGR